MSNFSKLPFAAFILSAFYAHATPSCRPLNSFEQGYELRQNQMMAAYNASARIDVRGSWDLYCSGSYIFWQPREENLELGILNNNRLVITPITIAGRVANMNFNYKSGFKAGLGILSNQDNWDVFAQYTWLRGRQHSHATAPTNGVIIPFWGHPTFISMIDPADPILTAKSRWRLALDTIDAQLARSYYVGTKLTFRPFFAGRVAWIKQKFTAVYEQTTNPPYQVRYSSHSWGLGPEAGITTNWLLGYGVRVTGSAEADILYTRYNTYHQEQNGAVSSTPIVSLYQRHLCYLRPHTDLELGLGWGTYFFNHNYHFDISGSYGFQVFWNQNMFRNFVDDVAVGKSYSSGGDLYIHGVTGELRFDF